MHIHHHPIQSAFSTHHGSGAMIEFFDDASYVHSDLVVYDRADHALYAVLHGRDYFLGHLTPDLAEDFATSTKVLLAAAHHTGRHLKLHVPLKVAE